MTKIQKIHFLTLLHQKKEFLKFSKFSHNLLIKNVLNPESLWKITNNDVDRAFPNFQFLNVRITLVGTGRENPPANSQLTQMPEVYRNP